MKRRLYGLALGVVAAWPISAVAAPSPSPSLDTILAPPPAAYTTPVSSPVSGAFTASGFAQSWGQDSARAASELDRDGFVAGFGLARRDRASGRITVEFVIAFTGQSGALRFLGADSAETVADSHYLHPDTNPNLGNYYYGAHEAQASPTIVVDGFEFVKGNDMFGVAFYSTRDDVLPLVNAQAAKVFQAAPAATISANDWPENQAPPATNAGLSGGFENPLVLAAIAVIGVLLLGGVFMAMRRSEARAVGSADVPVQQMSADGNFWWGGSTWVSITEVAPPWAQRSPDGAFWWNGREWRPVPGAAPLGSR